VIAKRLLLSLVGGLLFAGAAVTQAHAEDGYRFWGYYQWSGSQWTFAQKGPDGVVPADGSVEGWRYGTAGMEPRPPRHIGDFGRICQDVPAESGKKRVAVLIDQGTADDAPEGQEPAELAAGTCVVTAPTSTGAQVLAAIGPVRIEKGLTCGIDGYPAKGCSEPVKEIKLPDGGDPSVLLRVNDPVGASVVKPNPSSGPEETNDDGTNWTPYIIIAVLVVGLGAGGVLLVRRRRT